MADEFDTSIDTSGVDTLDTSDVVDDLPEDIPEDVPEEEPEAIEGNDFSDDIPEDVPEEEPESVEGNDFSDDIPEDVPEEEPESVEDNDFSDDIPEDVPEEEPESVEDNDFSDDIPEDVPESEPESLEENGLTNDVPENVTDEPADTSDSAIDAGNSDSTEPTEGTEDNLLDGAAADDSVSDVDSANSAEMTENTHDEPPDDSAPDDSAEDTASDVDFTDSTEPTETSQHEQLNDTTAETTANDTNDVQDGPSKVLKRDELDLLKSGNDAVNQRLAATADDYRDKGFSEEEIQDRLAADKWNFQKEFLEDAFPGQDVSPNVFNGFSENGSKDRIADIEQSETLRNQLRAGEVPEETAVGADNSSSAELTTNDQVDSLSELENTENSDGTDWSRTSLRPEEEALLHEMEENGEIEFPQENPDLEDPVHTDLHLPTEKTGEFLGEKGNSEFKPVSEKALSRMTQYGRDTVEYSDGYPDFSSFTSHDSEWGKINGQVEIGHMTGNRENPTWEYGKRPRGSGHDPHYDLGNFSQADNEIAKQFKDTYPQITGTDIEKYRKENHLTWHECADGKTMQLVPEEIHSACRHSGGVSEMKYRMAWGDITRAID